MSKVMGSVLNTLSASHDAAKIELWWFDDDHMILICCVLPGHVMLSSASPSASYFSFSLHLHLLINARVPLTFILLMMISKSLCLWWSSNLDDGDDHCKSAFDRERHSDGRYGAVGTSISQHKLTWFDGDHPHQDHHHDHHHDHRHDQHHRNNRDGEDIEYWALLLALVLVELQNIWKKSWTEKCSKDPTCAIFLKS